MYIYILYIHIGNITKKRESKRYRLDRWNMYIFK